MQLTFATQPSLLACWQNEHVIQLLQLAHEGLICRKQVITTCGDGQFENPYPEVDSKELFIRELEEALLTSMVDAVVYSLKDLPLRATPGIIVAAIPKRGDVFDVLVSANGWNLSSLPEGARIGTSSVRRSAQLLAKRPDLKMLPLIGSIDTRLQKLQSGEFDALVLAQAGLTCLGLQAHISEVFSPDVMLPAPGQGALAIQCRQDDRKTLELLASIHDPITAAAVNAERTFLSAMGVDYSFPVAAFADKNEGGIILTGAVISLDGKQSIRLSAFDQDPYTLGERLAQFVLERGAVELLKAGL